MKKGVSLMKEYWFEIHTFVFIFCVCLFTFKISINSNHNCFYMTNLFFILYQIFKDILCCSGNGYDYIILWDLIITILEIIFIILLLFHNLPITIFDFFQPLIFIIPTLYAIIAGWY